MSRQAWRDFICAPDRAGRHLSAIGRGVSGSVSDAIDHAALTSFLEKLHDSAEDTRLLGTVIDLIAGGYSRFASDALPRILDALSNEMLAQEQIVGPGLRELLGPILAPNLRYARPSIMSVGRPTLIELPIISFFHSL